MGPLRRKSQEQEEQGGMGDRSKRKKSIRGFKWIQLCIFKIIASIGVTLTNITKR